MSDTTKRALEESLKHMLLKKPLDKISISDITNDCGISRSQLERYLYKVTYALLLNVVNEEAEGMSVDKEDKAFIAHFYQYAFVGLMLEWIQDDMREDPAAIIERLTLLMQGNFARALEAYRTDKT